MAREGLMDDCGYEPYVDEEAWNDGFKAGFLMAVDEFAEKIKFMAGNKWIYDLCEDKDCKDFIEDIDEIAEQLKKQ